MPSSEADPVAPVSYKSALRRNSETAWSSSRASSDTWDLDSDVTPSASTRPSTRLDG